MSSLVLSGVSAKSSCGWGTEAAPELEGEGWESGKDVIGGTVGRRTGGEEMIRTLGKP
jgi:hypothetical protein